MQSSKLIKILLLVVSVLAVNQLPNSLFAETGDPVPNTATSAAVSQEGFIGEVKLFAGNFAPRGWEFCHGQLLAISSNTALFSIIGTTYGGDGRTTFALPDLRSRVAVGAGNGPGLSDVRLGDRKGREEAQLIVQNLPSHTHFVQATLNAIASGEAASSNAAGNGLASASRGGGGGSPIYARGANSVTLREDAISATAGPTGGNIPFSIVQPSLGMNYIICTQGVFPSRN